MKVLITDGRERPALAATRSLGRRGFTVVVGSDRPRSLAAASRYCDREVVYPAPDGQSSVFASHLVDVIRRERIDIVLPITDVSTHEVSKHAAILAPYCAVAAPPFHAFELATDKVRLLERAQSCGLTLPRTRVVRARADLASAIRSVTYPAVVKPIRSKIPTADGWLPASVQYARDGDELIAAYEATPALAGHPSLIQERIIGPGVGLFVLCDRGRIVATFSHRRHREKPPSGGASVLSESVPVDPILREQAQRLFGSLCWHGVAMLEYKRDLRSGHHYLMEVNGRFWGSLQLAIDAGIDFPYLACQLAIGDALATGGPYRVGVRNRWFLGDLDHLFCRLFHSDRELPEGTPGRWRAVLNFLNNFDPHTRNEIARRDDLGPALREVADYVRALGQSASARGRRYGRSDAAEMPIASAPVIAEDVTVSK